MGLELTLNEEHPLAQAYRVVHFGELLVRMHAATLAAMALTGSPTPDDVKVAAEPTLKQWKSLGDRARARARGVGRVGDTWSATWTWFHEHVADLRNLLAHGVAPGARAANDDARFALDRLPDLGWVQEASARSPTSGNEGLSPCVLDVDGQTADLSPVFAWAWIDQRWQPVAYRLRRPHSTVFEVLGGPLDHRGAQDWGAIPVSGRGASGGNPWIPDAVVDASREVYGWGTLEASLTDRLNGGERVLLRGAPGSGKSALFARLATRVSENRQRGQVFAHAFRRGVTVTPWADLAVRLAGLLDRRGEHPTLDPDGLAALVRRVGAPKLILLDGLDELDARDLARLVEWLSRLPPWATVLCTARPGVELDGFRRQEMAPLHVEEWCHWFQRAAPRTYERLLRQLPSTPEGTHGMSRHPWLQEVDRRSGGLPGYLRMCFELMDDRTMGDWAEVPEAGPSWFGRLAELHGLDDAAVGVPAATALVALAPEPLPTTILGTILPRVAPGSVVDQTLPRLRSLVREHEVDGLLGWTPFHETLRDWVLRSDDNARARTRAERALARVVRRDPLPKEVAAARWVGRQRVLHLREGGRPDRHEPELRFLSEWIAVDEKAAKRLTRLTKERPPEARPIEELERRIVPLLDAYEGDTPVMRARRRSLVATWLAHRGAPAVALAAPLRDLVASRRHACHWLLDRMGRIHRWPMTGSPSLPTVAQATSPLIALLPDRAGVLGVDQAGWVHGVDTPEEWRPRSVEIPGGGRVLAAALSRARGGTARLYVVAAAPHSPKADSDVDYVLSEHTWTKEGIEPLDGVLLGTRRPTYDADTGLMLEEPDPDFSFHLAPGPFSLFSDDVGGPRRRKVLASRRGSSLRVGEPESAPPPLAADSALGGEVTVQAAADAESDRRYHGTDEPIPQWTALHHRSGDRVRVIAVPAPISHVSIGSDGSMLVARQSRELFAFTLRSQRR